MRAVKITISIDKTVLSELDLLVQSRVFRNRNEAVQAAIEHDIRRLKQERLSHECALLDPFEERAMAEAGMANEAETWPQY